MSSHEVTEQKRMAVLCDLDNTLLDFGTAKIAACNSVAAHVGAGTGESLLSYFLLGFHGYESHENIRDFLKDLGVYREDVFLDACRLYERVKIEEIQAFKGVLDTFVILREAHVPIGIITDADLMHAISRLDRIGALQYIDSIVTPDQTGVRKPDPRGFLISAEQLGVPPKSVYVVGDSLRREIEPAGKLGMTTIYARYGDRSGSASKAVPDYTIMAFSDILMIMGLCNDRTRGSLMPF